MRNLADALLSASPFGTKAKQQRGDTGAPLAREKPMSHRARSWHQFRRQRTAMIGGVVLLALVFSAVFAGVLAPYDPAEQIPKASLQPPSTTYLFGTDVFGRDIFSRILYGGRISLRIGLISVAIAATNGVILGLIAGYYRGWIGGLIMRVMDMLLALPGILLALVIVAVLGPSITNVMFAVGVSVIPVFTRVVRGSVLAARETQYVEAARVVGCPNRLILRRHILPNIVAPVLVLATLNIAWAIIIGASLSYLGVGVQPPTSEWGAMLSDGRDYLRGQWWIATFPGAAIFITVLAMNLLGDGLGEAFDPRSSKR
jgi:peptide/nickel transport system permease protein